MLLDRKSWESRFDGYYRGEVSFNMPVSDHTGLSIGGPADVITSPADPLSMKNLLLILGKEKVPYFPLGSGTNVLVRDGGIEGVVIRFGAFRRIEVISEEVDHAELFVEAGCGLQRLVNFCREKGYAGIEGLAGIPGTVGGAICGNAGSYGCEIKDVLASVVILRSDGSLDRFKTEDLGFGYRKSDILRSDIVMSANVRMKRDSAEAVAARTEGFFAGKKAAQPISERSAGCVFKNPEGMSAGKLIDEAGCKGMREGDIEVSPVHANFFINCGKGTAADYLHLMENVSSRVRQLSGIMLEPEIRIVGRA